MMTHLPWLKPLIAALAMVESGNKSDAIGDSGDALGCLQIHAEVVADVNRIYGTDYAHADALDPIKAVRICELYLRYWCGHVAKPTPEIAARIWNGGPRGYMKPATAGYWARVDAAMQRGGA